VWVTKLLIFPVDIRIFCPKTTKIGIFGQFGPVHAGLFNALLWVGWWLWGAGCISQDTYLLYVGNKTFDFSSKKRIFCPKTTKFGPKLAFLVNLGQAYSVPC